MDSLTDRIRAVYHQHPVTVTTLLALALVVGLYLGFRVVGPALFG